MIASTNVPNADSAPPNSDDQEIRQPLEDAGHRRSEGAVDVDVDALLIEPRLEVGNERGWVGSQTRAAALASSDGRVDDRCDDLDRTRTVTERMTGTMTATTARDAGGASAGAGGSLRPAR